MSEYELEIPETLKAGAYANAIFVRHTSHEFTLDFAARQAIDPHDPDVLPFLLTARVKLPPTAVFDVLRAVNGNMTLYETRFGEIRRIDPLQEDDREGPAF